MDVKNARRFVRAIYEQGEFDAEYGSMDPEARSELMDKENFIRAAADILMRKIIKHDTKQLVNGLGNAVNL